MLTMIAETMLSEAYFKGGSVVGLSTLLGFLVAIYSKTLEPVDPQNHKTPHRGPSETAADAPVTRRSQFRVPLQVGGGADSLLAEKSRRLLIVSTKDAERGPGNAG